MNAWHWVKFLGQVAGLSMIAIGQRIREVHKSGVCLFSPRTVCLFFVHSPWYFLLLEILWQLKACERAISEMPQPPPAHLITLTIHRPMPISHSPSGITHLSLQRSAKSSTKIWAYMSGFTTKITAHGAGGVSDEDRRPSSRGRQTKGPGDSNLTMIFQRDLFAEESWNGDLQSDETAWQSWSPINKTVPAMNRTSYLPLPYILRPVTASPFTDTEEHHHTNPMRNLIHSTPVSLSNAVKKVIKGWKYYNIIF
jgi:hypothetical protein